MMTKYTVTVVGRVVESAGVGSQKRSATRGRSPGDTIADSSAAGASASFITAYLLPGADAAAPSGLSHISTSAPEPPKE